MDDCGRCGLKPSLSAWKPLRGWRFGYHCHIPGRPGLIQPAGLARPQPGLMEIENLFRYTALAVGLMEIENLFRSTALAVGLMEIEN